MTTYNVKDFGAIGDGKHDDRAAIQAAVNAANAAGGGTVYLPEGVYSVTHSAFPSHSAAIELFDNTTLQGAGKGLSTIKLADDQPPINGIVRTPYGKGSHDVTVEDLTIDGNRDHQTNLQNGFFSGVIPGSPAYDKNITLSSVEIKDCSGFGFDPHEITKNLLIEDSVSHGNGRDGFTLDFQIDAVVRNSVAYDNDAHGFLAVTTSNGVLFENDESYGNAQTGLTVGGDTKNVTISGGSYHENTESGIYLRDGSGALIENASIYKNQETGITVGGFSNVTIRDNQITDNSQVGNGKFSQILLKDWTDQISGETAGATGVDVHNNTIASTGSIHAKTGIEEHGIHTNDNTQSSNTISGFSYDATKFNPDAHADSLIVSTDTYAKFDPALFLANDHDPEGQALSLKSVGDDSGGTAGLDHGLVNFKSQTAGDASFHYTLADSAGGLAEGAVKVTVVATSNGADTLTLDTPSGGQSFVDGHGGDDSLTGGAGYDVLSGGDGNDRLDGGGGADLLSGGNGDDTYYVGSADDSIVEWFAGGSGGNDAVFSSVDYTLAQNLENLTLVDQAEKGIGNKLANDITGNAGANRLDGKEGDDRLDGGAGNDTLTGGSGKDFFKFAANAGHDTVTDFADGLDRLDFRGSGLHYSDMTIGTKGADATVTYGSSEIVIVGQAGHISDSDFMFA